MPTYRSRTTTHGRNMAGARGLWRATGMKNSDFGKPIIAVANSFTQFVPGHVHLKDLGQLVARAIEAAGGVAKEFNTIAVDDGIAMGHDGMLYSLPSRDLIADCGRVHGQRPLRRRDGVHLELRQDHPRHAERRDAAQHPGRVRLRRADGGRQGQGEGRDPRARPGRRDGGGRGRQVFRRRDRDHRGGGLPDLRLLLGHVHRQLDELPDRGAGPEPARQRLDPGDACRPQAPVRGGRAADRRAGQAALRAERRFRAAAGDRDQGRVRERDGARHRHGRLHQHGAAHPAPPPTRAGSTSPWTTSMRSAARCRSCARWPRPSRTCTWRTCTAPAASWRSWASSTAPA